MYVCMSLLSKTLANDIGECTTYKSAICLQNIFLTQTWFGGPNNDFVLCV